MWDEVFVDLNYSLLGFFIVFEICFIVNISDFGVVGVGGDKVV